MIVCLKHGEAREGIRRARVEYSHIPENGRLTHMETSPEC